MEKSKVLRVTITEDYWIDMIDDKRTVINGWTMEQVIEEWFKNYSLNSHHASREGHRIGGGRKFIRCEIVEE